MNCYIIAEAGGSKTDWVAVNAKDGSVSARCKTAGINAALMQYPEIQAIATEAYEKLGINAPDALYFYGAGCAAEMICSRVASILQRVFNCKIEINSDLLACARGLLGKEPGIAAIIGTGSNSCYYDGEEIRMHTPALGFILGDEGGGAVIGRQFISDYFKGIMPEDTASKFRLRFSISMAEAIDQVYRGSSPSRWLASFLPYLKENLNDNYIYHLIHQQIRNFFDRNLSHYPLEARKNLRLTGGVVSNFTDIIKIVAEEYGYDIKVIVDSPLEGLIRYHSASSLK